MSDGETKVTVVTVKIEELVEGAIGVREGVAAWPFGNHRRRRALVASLVVYVVRQKLVGLSLARRRSRFGLLFHAILG